MDNPAEHTLHTTHGDPGVFVPKLIIELGHRTAEYYRMLCDERLPPDLVRTLTRDWHAAQLAKWTTVAYTDRYKAPTAAETEHGHATRREVVTWLLDDHPSFDTSEK
jgi:hypothetical protein